MKDYLKDTVLSVMPHFPEEIRSLVLEAQDYVLEVKTRVN
jgi:hypothetical protein